jgi:hypothetical protein
MADKTKNLGLRGTVDQHRFLKELSVKTGKSVQRLFEEAIRYSYESNRQPTPPAVPASHLRAHALLEEILDGADRKTIDHITGTLKLYARGLAAAEEPPQRKHGS